MLAKPFKAGSKEVSKGSVTNMGRPRKGWNGGSEEQNVDHLVLAAAEGLCHGHAALPLEQSPVGELDYSSAARESRRDFRLTHE